MAPVRLLISGNLEGYIRDYLDVAGIAGENKDRPLFRSVQRRTGQLTGNAMTSKAICELVKRRLKDAGLPAAVTAFLPGSGGDRSAHAGHAAGGCAVPRRTFGAANHALYDRRQKRVTRNIVERISS